MLREYSEFVARVRKCVKEEASLVDAVERAVTECIREGILENFLRSQRSEVVAMSILEFNREEELKKLSLDDQKRLEYELRQKAIRDYNSQMNSALKQGREQGRHDALRELIGKKLEKGMSPEDIAEFMELNPDEVRELAEEWKKKQ